MQRMTHHKPHENLNQSKFTKSQKELPYRSHCRSIQKHHYRASYCIQYDLSACIDVITCTRCRLCNICSPLTVENYKH